MPYINLEEIERIERMSGFHGRFIHMENVTFADWIILEGSQAPEHSHPHEQITYLLEGKFEFVLGGEKQVLEPGKAAVIPGNVVHSGKALTDCHLVDVFYPVREDLR